VTIAERGEKPGIVNAERGADVFLRRPRLEPRDRDVVVFLEREPHRVVEAQAARFARHADPWRQGWRLRRGWRSGLLSGGRRRRAARLRRLCRAQ
jgi:hypothetical protein